jgi:hypothetical protein
MNTINASTGFSPFQLRLGRSPRIIPPIIPKSLLTPPQDNAEASPKQVIEQIALDIAKVEGQFDDGQSIAGSCG